MFETDITEQIYNKVADILLNANELSYCNTRQRGFHPKGDNLVSPTLYPWLFIEYGSTTEPRSVRTLRWEYEYTIPIVVMTMADKGDFDDLIFNTTGKNLNKGVGTMIYDVKKLMWSYHKGGLLGIDEIQDWNIGASHQPNILSVQRVLFSEYVRGLQMELIFRVWEQEQIP